MTWFKLIKLEFPEFPEFPEFLKNNNISIEERDFINEMYAS